MRSTWHPAPSPLAGVLAGTWCVHATRDADLSARVLPDATSCLVFQRAGTLLRSEDDGGRPWSAACVSGPRSGPFDFTLGAGGGILIVQLVPGGATSALGVPASSLADRFEPIDAVIDADPRRLADRVANDADDIACVRAVERWLVERVRTISVRDDRADTVVRDVARCAGRVRIDHLAARVDLSRRHLGRIVRERVGFSPKLFARIARFHHAVQLGRSRPTTPWARLALDAGYADQAHLTREFGALGGIRPGDLRSPAATLIW